MKTQILPVLIATLALAPRIEFDIEQILHSMLNELAELLSRAHLIFSQEIEITLDILSRKKFNSSNQTLVK